MELSDIKTAIDAQGRAWEEFKKANDAMLAAKADGKAIGDFEAKLAALSDALDKQGDVLAAVQKRHVFGTPATESEQSLAAEAKSFNLALRADLATKGKAIPSPLSTEAYSQYKSAFLELARHGNVEMLSSDERKALSAGSDPDGGYMLPASTVGRIVAKVYELSVMRQMATVQTISTEAMEGVIDNNEANAGWVTEIGARNETSTPQLGKWRIEAFEMYAAPRITQKLLDDAAVDVEGWLAAKVADKMARIESDAFWNGTGIGQPKGLAAYTTAATADSSRAWGQIEHVNTGTNGAFNASTKGDPLFDLIGAFRDAYLQRAQFCMRREVRTAIRKLKEATTDRYLWEPSLQAGVPDRLLGYPVRIDQYMPALGTGSLSLAFGDFAEAYTIIDRMGSRTLRDPYTAKPYVIFYTTRRVGGGVLNFEAVKFLRFGT